MSTALRWVLLAITSFVAGMAAAGCATDATSTADDDLRSSLLDRMGRAEVTAFLVCFRPNCSDADEAIKDRLNARHPFVTANHDDELLAAYEVGLARIDDMDQGRDFQTPHPLPRLFLDDALLVDVAKPCDVDTASYLDLEKALITGNEATTCGGRTPNDDAIDELMTLLINGPTRVEPRRRDGIDRPATPASKRFPYLAPPHRP